MRLKDHVAIITGGANGIGLAYVQRFLDEGANVVIADVDEGGVHDVIRQAKGATGTDRAVFIQCDIREQDQADVLAATAIERFGRIDCLVNNAALFTTLPRRPLEELCTANWLGVLTVNVIGTFHCTKAVVPHMKARKQGRIVNVASNVVQKGLPLLLDYVASKGAVLAMTRALARELGPWNINVNAIAPGYVLHERTRATDSGRNEQVVKLRALARTQTPGDLCGVVVFLASSEADFITGQTIIVDGGEVFT